MPYEVQCTTSENPGRWVVKRWSKQISTAEALSLMERVRGVTPDEDLVECLNALGAVLAGLVDFNDEPGTAKSSILRVQCEVRYE